jgi:heme-degrading monooxygenase HmoA
VVDTNAAKVVIVVRFRSRLSADEIKRRYPERMPEFREVPGLVQKYYIYDESANEWGGIYVWDSEESADAYLASDLRKSIASTYEVEGAPRIDRLNVFDVLR